ncbi:succinate dehydrogenase cytochrome b subunit [Actinoalloteichus spitiensis]|uniref:succinate dehydrogenase cytochrome b subunit n=1 Tax=Actinoalloteichus spitiensis TaxID=252394 RepID=UPI001FE1A342|nr:succinate dehydrogenase cytochrome b subunit [Actinoalloteichus spitiensis]
MTLTSGKAATPGRAARDPRRTGPLRRLWASSVGKKAVMAGTGLILFFYVVAHMVGNLKIFFGETAFDSYARWLRAMGSAVLGESGALWTIRVVLLVSVLLHMTAAIQLTRRARAARPSGYRHRPPVQGGYAARTMRWGGVIIALFVVYHVLDLTVGWLNPHGVPEEPFRNVTSGFQLWWVVLIYTVAVLALGLHVRHGVWSALRSLGTVRASHGTLASTTALVVAVVLCAGYLSVPYAVLFGLVE